MQFFRNRYRRAELMECWLEDIRNNVHGDEQRSAEDEQVYRAEDQQQRAALEKLAACISRLPDQDGIFIQLRYYKNASSEELVDTYPRHVL